MASVNMNFCGDNVTCSGITGIVVVIIHVGTLTIEMVTFGSLRPC